MTCPIEREPEMMKTDLQGRSFLKELDFTPEELAVLLDLSADLKAAKYAGTERPRLARQEHRADLREDVDAHALRVRGRGARPGRARHLPGPDRAPRSGTRSR